MPLLGQTSKQPGNPEDNASKTTKINKLRSKVLVKPLSIPPPLWKHGIINQSPWTSIEPGHQEGTGEDEEEVHKEEM